MSKSSRNVTHLNNQYISKLNYQQQLKQQRKKYLRRRLIIISIVGFVLLLIPTVPLVRDYLSVRNLKSEKVEATEQLAELEEYQDDLEYYIDLLNDDEYVAKLARSEYYLSQEDEVVFNLPEGYLPDHQRLIDEFHEKQAKVAEDES